MTSKEFIIVIEKLKREKRTSYIDAIVLYCEEHSIDPSTISKLVSKPLKEKIEIEARNLNLLQKQGTLPV